LREASGNRRPKTNGSLETQGKKGTRAHTAFTERQGTGSFEGGRNVTQPPGQREQNNVRRVKEKGQMARTQWGSRQRVTQRPVDSNQDKGKEAHCKNLGKEGLGGVSTGARPKLRQISMGKNQPGLSQVQ